MAINMTNNGQGRSTMFTREEWNNFPVTFHGIKGESVKFAKDNQEATRVKEFGCGIVLTANPLEVGQLFNVTVTKCNANGLGGLNIGLTKENPASSKLTKTKSLWWKKADRDMLHTSLVNFCFNNTKLCELGFDTSALQAGQSLGLLLTSEGECHWFLDGEWRGSVSVKNFPLDQPMWGVVDVYGRCERIRANVHILSECPSNSEKKMGLTTGLSFFKKLLRIGPTQPVSVPVKPLCPLQSEPQKEICEYAAGKIEQLTQQPQDSDAQIQDQILQLQDKDTEIHQLIRQLQNADAENELLTQQLRDKDTVIQQLAQQLRGADAVIQQLTQRLQGRDAEIQLLTKSNKQVTQFKQQLMQSNRQLQHINAENQRLVTTLRDQIDVHQRRVSSVPSNTQEVEFWQVSPDEISVRENQILGQGAWGYVAKGTFRGTKVAVKKVHREILQQTTVERIRREIRTMAQIRHPNLVLFIAAVLNEQTGPMIVTELLDISLRRAYQTNRVGPNCNKRRIFEDVASAILYLHRQREPIIHRDVSSANILLSALPNNTWLAKLSDFGSANLVRDATTPGEGAILYTAPEAFPQGLHSPQPRPRQTTKIDVYSFGVLVCELATQTFPEAELFCSLLCRVSREWGELHPLIVSCVSDSPQDRPSMDIVLQQLKRMDSEPYALYL